MESCLICYEDILEVQQTFVVGNINNDHRRNDDDDDVIIIIDSKDDNNDGNENYNISDGYNRGGEIGSECSNNNNDDEEVIDLTLQPQQPQQQLQQQHRGIFAGGSGGDFLSCGHQFCKHCLRQHVVVSIENKNYPPVCPAQYCKQIIPDQLCLTLLTADTSAATSTLQQQDTDETEENSEEEEHDDEHDDMDIEAGLSSSSSSKDATTTTTMTTNDTIQSLSTKFRRLKIIHENPTASVICTKCDAVFVPSLVVDIDGSRGDDDNDSSSMVDVECTECQHRFCKIHGDIHLGMSCKQYQQSDAYRALVESEQILDRYTKKCSRCGARIQKSTGCDYVVCGNCKKDMCYRCGTHIHMTGDQFRKCTNCGTYDMAHDASLVTQIPFWICVSLGFVAFTILYPILGIAFATVTCCLGCFCDFGRRIDNFQDPGPYQPRRGILWVVACICLPILIVVDSVYVAISGNEDGFMHTTFDDFFHLEKVADELPPMQTMNKDDILLIDDGDADDEENPIYNDVTSLPSSSSSSSLSPIDETISLPIESKNIDINKTSVVHGPADDSDLVVVVSEEEEEEEDNEEEALHVKQVNKEIPHVNLVAEDDTRPVEVLVNGEAELTPSSQQQPRLNSSEDRILAWRSTSYGSISEASSTSENE